MSADIENEIGTKIPVSLCAENQRTNRKLTLLKDRHLCASISFCCSNLGNFSVVSASRNLIVHAPSASEVLGRQLRGSSHG